MTIEEKAKRYADRQMQGHTDKDFWNFYYNFYLERYGSDVARHKKDNQDSGRADK